MDTFFFESTLEIRFLVGDARAGGSELEISYAHGMHVGAGYQLSTPVRGPCASSVDIECIHQRTTPVASLDSGRDEWVGEGDAQGSHGRGVCGPHDVGSG